MIDLAPSILAADFGCLRKELDLLEDAGVRMVHIDVMDGMFVPSISLGMPVIECLRPCSSLCFDVHLMVREPGRYLEAFSGCGADIISIHAEACEHLHRTVMQVKETGSKVCVALNPATPLSVLDYVLEELDMVLLMTVNPGFGGQSYIPVMTEKIRRLAEIIRAKGLSTPIEVDGGIKTENVRLVLEAGATRIVAGSSVFARDVQDADGAALEPGRKTKDNIEQFHRIFREFEQEESHA